MSVIMSLSELDRILKMLDGRLIADRFKQGHSIGVGSKGRYINYTRADPPEGASSVLWREFNEFGLPTGLSGEVIENQLNVLLDRRYLRGLVREDYGKAIEFASRNRGRNLYDIILPDGSIA